MRANPPFAVGDLVADKYRVTGLLGQGGMGIVLAAVHIHMHHTVAIKLMLDAEDPLWVERFQREAQIVAQLKSEHVCRSLDFGRLPNGSPYIVMEYLEGQTLSSMIHSSGALPVPLVIEIALQACYALREAHQMGIVHRDLKLSNLVLSRKSDGSPCLKLLDFGIAKATQDRYRKLTEAGVALGSPRFMAPEQLRDTANVDPRADIWSLGALLYEALSARPAFSGSTTPEVIMQVIQADPYPLATLRPDLPPALTAIVTDCLEKDRERRIGDIGVLEQRLLALKAAAPNVVAPANGRLTAVPAATVRDPSKTLTTRSRRWKLFALGGTLGSALALTAAFLLVGGTDDASKAADSSRGELDYFADWLLLKEHFEGEDVDEELYSIGIWQDFANVQMRDPNDGDRYVTYVFRSGRLDQTSDGYPPSDVQDRMFELEDVPFKNFGKMLSKAAKHPKVKRENLANVLVSRFMTGDEEVRISMYFYDGKKTRTAVFDADGDLVTWQ